VTTSGSPSVHAAIARFLTPRRLRAQAFVLALCLWGTCAVDYASPGIFDRAGNIKFQDFIQFPIAARLIAQGRAAELYNERVEAAEMRAIVGQTRVRLPYLYGPQVALFFVPFSRLPFLAQAAIWTVLSLLFYLACISVVSSACAELVPYRGLVLLGAIAFPPLFHFFVRGQLSVLVMGCFVAAYFAWRAGRETLAGLALGLLAFKPQFLVAIPLVLLFARAWKSLFALTLSAAAQLAFTTLYFGSSVMRSYFSTLVLSAGSPSAVELSLSSIQMHSLRPFWSLLIPWPRVVFVLYALSSIAAILMAVAIWKSSAPLAIRFSALTLAAVLVNPHLFIYDLLVLAPAFLWLADWALVNSEHPSASPLRILLYLAFILPLLGPLSLWTHLQFSVPVFAALLWLLLRISRESIPTAGHKLASAESRVV